MDQKIYVIESCSMIIIYLWMEKQIPTYLVLLKETKILTIKRRTDILCYRDNILRHQWMIIKFATP